MLSKSPKFAATLTRVPKLLAPKRGCSSDFSVLSALRPSQDAQTENLRLRRSLALSYRLMDRLELNEGTCNHLTVEAPKRDGGGGKVMLLAPGHLPDGSSLHWSEVTASSLIGVNENGEVVEDGSLGGDPERTAVCIHLGVRKVRPDCGAIFHLHSPNAASLSCLKDPTLLPIHQHCVVFHGRTAVYSEYGLADAFDEGVVIGQATKDKEVLFMANHGTLVIGPSCHRAFDDCYYLERACLFQMTALAAAGGDENKLSMLCKEFMDSDETHKSFRSDATREKYSIKHFFSWWNKYLREEPEVFS